MRALPTTYRGTHLRSRLEADWAATLDTHAIPWIYEPEGYKLDDGTCYSPDFWLPSARAWLEVKGGHMQRVDKVHQFAAQLWRESGATSTYDAEAPMVLVGTEPDPDWPLGLGKPMASLIGTMGPGKGCSVAMVTCSACDQGTVVSLWQPTCRGCGYWHGDGYEAWHQSTFDHYALGFERLRRPVGRGR